MCLMLLSSTEKKKVKRGTQRNKAALRTATPNAVTTKEVKTKLHKEKEYNVKQCSEKCCKSTYGSNRKG